MKILVTNVYSWENKWDATIVIAMIENLKKYLDFTKLWISTVDSWDKWKYWNYKYYDSIINYVSRKNKYIEIISSIYLIFRICIWWFVIKNLKVDLSALIFSKKIRAKINSYKEYNIIIACWGGYTWTKWFFSIIPKCLFLQDFFIAYYLGKPIYLFSQSFWPLNNKIHWYIYKFFLGKVNLMLLRENISLELAKKYNFRNIHKTWDIAFNLESENFKKNKLSETIIGITARSWLRHEEQNKYEQALAINIEKIIDFYGINKVKILFVPQVIYSKWWDNDLKCYKRIWSKIKKKYQKSLIFDEVDYSPVELKKIIWKCDIFIWTRMHSNILALSSKVKTIAIAYEHKTTWIMLDLWISNYCVDINNISWDKIYKLFLKLINDENYMKVLEEKLELYQSSSDKAWLLIKNDLGWRKI